MDTKKLTRLEQHAKEAIDKNDITALIDSTRIYSKQTENQIFKALGIATEVDKARWERKAQKTKIKCKEVVLNF